MAENSNNINSNNKKKLYHKISEETKFALYKSVLDNRNSIAQA